jgi:hypothetical protein
MDLGEQFLRQALDTRPHALDEPRREGDMNQAAQARVVGSVEVQHVALEGL